jgi:hypothetical protein
MASWKCMAGAAGALMVRRAIRHVRHGLYAPIDLVYDVGLSLPRWVLLLVVEIDKPLVALIVRVPTDRGVSGS